jgi:sigma-B regulation protein RsbU (phosphoserine phosphatase)
VRYCNGGHNLPYIRRKDGSIEMLEDTDGLLLGKIPRIEYDVKKIKLEPGDHLLVYTDGVTEAMNLEGEFYEEPRLESTMATANASTAENLVKTVLRDVLQFANGADPSDDITVLDLMRVK